MPTLEFHHFGIACRDIEQETASYKHLGYRVDGGDFDDHVQGVHGRFLVGGGPRLELLTPLPGSEVLDPWLAAGTRIYHQAYETDDLQTSIDDLIANRARVVVEPVPAIAFEGRKIAFLMLRNMSMIELIAR